MSQLIQTAASNGTGGGDILVTYGSSAFPGGGLLPSITIVPASVINFSSGAGNDAFITESYLQFAWTSTQSGGSVNGGRQIVLGQTVRNDAGTNSTLRALVRVNNTSRISEVFF